MPRASTLEVLADLAEDQWGLFTRRQAEATGMAWSTLARLVADGAAERVAHGVYRLRGAPPVDHLELRAAWMQLAPSTPVWQRRAEQGVVSHRSAAALLDLGHLPADVHQFTMPVRRRSRRADVTVRSDMLSEADWMTASGVLVTRPARTVADLLGDREDLTAVGHAAADALRRGLDEPTRLAAAAAPFAHRYGLDRQDGAGLLDWMLRLAGAPERARWVRAAESEARPGSST